MIGFDYTVNSQLSVVEGPGITEITVRTKAFNKSSDQDLLMFISIWILFQTHISQLKNVKYSMFKFNVKLKITMIYDYIEVMF